MTVYVNYDTKETAVLGEKNNHGVSARDLKVRGYNFAMYINASWDSIQELKGAPKVHKLETFTDRKEFLDNTPIIDKYRIEALSHSLKALRRRLGDV